MNYLRSYKDYLKDLYFEGLEARFPSKQCKINQPVNATCPRCGSNKVMWGDGCSYTGEYIIKVPEDIVYCVDCVYSGLYKEFFIVW